MTALLKLIPWWCYILAVLLVVIAYQALALHIDRADEAKYKAADNTYQSAQKTNLATIATLQAANARWASEADDVQANAKAYAAAEAEYEAQQRSLSVTTTKKLKVYYASHPLARAWAATPVDPGVVEQLHANAGN